jgi:2-pyrone-4,6-dicarboxylate lactonase
VTELALPAGAWDCHAHVFGLPEAFPLRRKGPGIVKPGTTIEALLGVHRALGIAHGSLVQPVEYGADHSYLLRALETTGLAYAGVAMGDPDLGEAEMVRLAAHGVSALRLMFLDAVGLTPSPAVLRDRIAAARALGWRLRILGSPASHPQLFEALTEARDVPILLEHMAMAGPGPVHPLLAEFLAQPNVWVMLSSGHRRSALGPPYADMTETGAALWRLAPERSLWGSDWPYLGAGPQIPEHQALALLASYLPDETAWAAVLTRNPAAFHGR